MSAGITLTTFGTAVGIAGGINALTGGGVSSAQAQQMADPFSQYRSKLGEMYSGALQPGAPSNIEAMPGYSQYKTGVIDPAMKASERTAAASGQLYSGKEQEALQKTGQQGYYGFMTDYMNRLAQGSGAVNNPATAAGMGLAQAGSNQQGFMQGLGALGTSVSGLAGQVNSMGNVAYNPSTMSPTTQYGSGVGSLLSGTGGIGD
jgi:hypothetical protein